MTEEFWDITSVDPTPLRLVMDNSSATFVPNGQPIRFASEAEAGWSVADARAQEIADLRTAVASLAVANCKLRQRIAELELARGGAA